MENRHLQEVLASWGISEDSEVMYVLRHTHSDIHEKTSIIRLDGFLRKAAHPEEIPAIMNQFSPILGGSMLEYMLRVPGGAVQLIARLNRELAIEEGRR